MPRKGPHIPNEGGNEEAPRRRRREKGPEDSLLQVTGGAEVNQPVAQEMLEERHDVDTTLHQKPLGEKDWNFLDEARLWATYHDFQSTPEEMLRARDSLEYKGIVRPLKEVNRFLQRDRHLSKDDIECVQDVRAYAEWTRQHGGDEKMMEKAERLERRLIATDLSPEAVKLRGYDAMPQSAGMQADLYRDLQKHLQNTYFRGRDNSIADGLRFSVRDAALAKEISRLRQDEQDEQFRASLPEREAAAWALIQKSQEASDAAEQALIETNATLQRAEASLANRSAGTDVQAAQQAIDRMKQEAADTATALQGMDQERTRIRNASELFDRNFFLQWHEQNVPGGRLGGVRRHIWSTRLTKGQMLENANAREQGLRTNLDADRYETDRAEDRRDDLLRGELDEVRRSQEQLSAAKQKTLEAQRALTEAQQSWRDIRQMAEQAQVQLPERKAA